MRTDTSDIFEGLRKTDIIVIKRTSNLVSRNKRHNPAILMDYLEQYQSNNVELKSVPEVLSRRTINHCARRTCYQYHYICNWLTFFSFLDGRYDIDATRFLHMSVNTRHARARDSPPFELDIPRKKLLEHNFWFRAPSLANRLPQRVQFFKPVALKSRLLQYFWSHFQSDYLWMDSTTWRL